MIKYGTLKKQKEHAFGKDVYLLGKDRQGVRYWLEQPSWDCDWYWGFGYIKTYTNNLHPSRARDIRSHQHADNFMRWCIEWNGREPILHRTIFTEREAWALCELFERFYLFKKLAELYHKGFLIARYSFKMKSPQETERINKEILPPIMNAIIDILKPDE